MVTECGMVSFWSENFTLKLFLILCIARPWPSNIKFYSFPFFKINTARSRPPRNIIFENDIRYPISFVRGRAILNINFIFWNWHSSAVAEQYQIVFFPFFKNDIARQNWKWFFSALAKKYNFWKNNWYYWSATSIYKIVVWRRQTCRPRRLLLQREALQKQRRRPDYFWQQNWYYSAMAEQYHFRKTKMIFLGLGRVVSCHVWKIKFGTTDRPRQ